ncbi:MAG: PEP-CTERM sorting domain-containing protein [Verrucomicrobiaceae bacterium]|nr:PEP-CTERM sorting domain-containing protein [Verrucomicrobiaceae bacterium]
MKKLIYPLCALAFASTVSASTITTSTNAADITDLATTATTFSGTDITLSVDADTNAYQFKANKGSNVTVEIADGKKLSFVYRGANTLGSEVVAFNNSTITFKGGTVQVTADGESYWNGTLNFYSNFSGKQASLRDGTLNIYNGWTSWSMSQQAGTINMYGGTVDMGQAAFWGRNAVVNINKGVTFKASSIRLIDTGSNNSNNTMNLNGTATISGNLGTGTLGTNSSFFGANLVIGSTGVLTTNGTADASILKKLDIAGKWQATSNIYMVDKSTLMLRSGSQLLSNSKTTQAESIVKIANIYYAKGGTGSRPVQLAITSDKVTKADVTVDLYGAQKLGRFEFYKDSSITLNFKEGSSLEIGKFASMSDYVGDFFVNLAGSWEDDVLKITSMTQSEIEALSFKLNGTKMILGTDYMVEATEGGFYINTVAVPEPAQWAMIFGVIALGMVAYRRRK